MAKYQPRPKATTLCKRVLPLSSALFDEKMQQMLLNGKLGAVCTQLYELYDLFGVRTEEGMLIDFSITNEEIAKFCGISTASSVNRILKQLKKMVLSPLKTIISLF